MTEQTSLTPATLIKDAIESAKDTRAKDTRVEGEAIPSTNEPSLDRVEPSDSPETQAQVVNWRDGLPDDLT